MPERAWGFKSPLGHTRIAILGSQPDVARTRSATPASLYRNVGTRDEIVELMANQAYGEISATEPASGTDSGRRRAPDLAAALVDLPPGGDPPSRSR